MDAVIEGSGRRHPTTGAMRSIEQAFLIGVEGVTEVVLARHGDCYETLDTTHDDPPLSPLGAEQARLLGRRLATVGFAAVYASPLRRALETARAVQPDVTVDDRLVETTTAISDDGHVEMTEPPESAIARVSAAVTDAVAAHSGGRVLMVFHAMAMLHYLSDVLRIEPGRFRFLPYYTSLSTVRVLGDRRMAGSLGDVAHLEGLRWAK